MYFTIAIAADISHPDDMHSTVKFSCVLDKRSRPRECHLSRCDRY
ncbi:MAG: hypothetical protein SAL07_15125 [Oscillatoria sp. PMC 1051.18]|nr:hypothetical protein [Oscillatoria sp. PMC 1050.18]MEC5031229.1 hypothetical protein [Oscillatoria sp. PMC 1051.18]